MICSFIQRIGLGSLWLSHGNIFAKFPKGTKVPLSPLFLLQITDLNKPFSSCSLHWEQRNVDLPVGLNIKWTIPVQTCMTDSQYSPIMYWQEGQAKVKTWFWHDVRRPWRTLIKNDTLEFPRFEFTIRMWQGTWK